MTIGEMVICSQQPEPHPKGPGCLGLPPGRCYLHGTDDLDDGEFWDLVFNRAGEGPEIEPDPGEEPLDDIDTSDLTPCSVCGERGPCGYDNEGMPLIHLNTDEGNDE